MKSFVYGVMIGICVFGTMQGIDAGSPPVVSNVQVAQRRDGSKLVDITYDLSGGVTDSVWVTAEFSADSGKVWMPLTTVTGAVGRGVVPGVGKQVVWNAGVDYPGQVRRGCQVRVTADETPPARAVTLPGGATMELVYIAPGTFLMGSPDSEVGRDAGEGPQHQVTITKDCYIGKYEVTQRQWESVMGTRPWAGQGYVQDNPDHPAVYVSWGDAQEFIGRLNAAEGAAVYRLPTEAEWEDACWVGTVTRWSFGEDESRLTDYAWYNINAWNVGERYAHRVGTKVPNPWGLYDMHGNVWEWVQDWYGSYASSTQVDPVGPNTGSGRVIRGGGFNGVALGVRAATRSYYSPSIPSYGVGIRLLRQGQ